MEKKKRLEKFQRGKLFLHRWQMGGLFLLAALTTGLIQMPQQGNLDGLLETAHSTEKQDTDTLNVVSFTDATQDANLADTSSSYALAAADYDMDGDIDLAISHHGYITIRENLGEGIFAPPIYPGGNYLRDVHGLSFADFNNDSRTDLVVMKGAKRGQGQGANEYYLNKKKGFKTTKQPDLLTDSFGRGRSSVPLDLNGDGWLDILLLNITQKEKEHRLAISTHKKGTKFSAFEGGNRFPGFRMNGVIQVDIFNKGENLFLVRSGPQNAGAVFMFSDGIFKNMTKDLGLPKGGDITAAIPFDYDNDGDMDIFLASSASGEQGTVIFNEQLFFKYQYVGIPKKSGFRFAPPTDSLNLSLRVLDSRRCTVFFGQARTANHFTESISISVSSSELQGNPRVDARAGDKGVFIWRDNQGDIVIEVVTDQKTAKEIVGTIETDGAFPDTLIEFGNVKNNSAPRNRLFRNDGYVFTDVSQTAGFIKEAHAMDAVAADFNNDGFIDIFVVNGTHIAGNEADQLFLNNGDGTFTDISSTAFSQQTTEGSGDCAVVFDYDGDGDLDIFVANGHGGWPTNMGPFTLWQNNSDTSNNFLQIDLRGTISTTQAWGARVTVKANGHTTYFQKSALNGNLATSDLPIHVGLGEAKYADEVIINWPSGLMTKLENVAAGQVLLLKEPAN